MRNLIKGLLAMALTAIMVIAAIPGLERLQGVMRVQADGGQATAPVSISVTDSVGASAAGCTVSVNSNAVWGNGVTTVGSVTGSGNVNFSVGLVEGYKVTYVVRDGDNFSAVEEQTVHYSANGNNSFGGNWDVADGKSYTLTVTFAEDTAPGNGGNNQGGNNQGGNNQGGNNQGGNNNPPQQNNEISVTFNISGTGSDLVGCIKVTGSAQGQERGINTYGSPVDVFVSQSYTIEIEPAIQATINSVQYGGSNLPLSNGKAVLSNVQMSDGDSFSFVVDIEVDTGFTNIIWGYDEAEWANNSNGDCYVDPNTGTIEVLNIERNGSSVFEYNPEDDSQWEWEERGGGQQIKKYVGNDNNLTVNIEYDQNRSVILSWYVACRENDIVTFCFVPKPGYQLGQASINGMALDPQEEDCLFNIEMRNLLHISGVFVQRDNQTAVDSETVTYATLSGTGGIECGTLAASIEDSSDPVPSDATIKAAMDNAGEFVDTVGSVDIGMTQIISKGGNTSYVDHADDYWAHEQHRLGESVELSLAVPNNLQAGQTYSIVREHDGVYEQIDAVYNADLEMLTFESDRFSQYTIIVVEGEPETGVTNSTATAAPEFNQYKHDMENLLATGSGSAVGGGLVVEGSTGTITAQATTQGPKYKEVIHFFMPTGWTEGFSFNILVDGKANYNSKSGTMTINIPKYLRKEGRQFMIMAVDKNGNLFVYADNDLNADTLSVTIPKVEGYAFTVIYTDL